MAFLIAGMTSYAQGNLRLGINVGLPVGDVDELYSFDLGADLSYMFGTESGFSVGPMVGYSHFFGKTMDTGFGEVDLDDVSFLPIAASGRIGLSESFFLGADIGYALGITEDVDGGFYYRPKLGFDLFGLGLIASYSGVSMDGGSFSSVNLGVEFGL